MHNNNRLLDSAEQSFIQKKRIETLVIGLLPDSDEIKLGLHMHISCKLGFFVHWLWPFVVAAVLLRNYSLTDARKCLLGKKIRKSY